jgi:hypothetical protein
MEGGRRAGGEVGQYGRTPLWWAAKGGHEAVVKLLLGTVKVKVDSKDNKYGRFRYLSASDKHEVL